MNVAKNTGLLGRWQVLQQEPKIVCDVGHNVDGITQIVRQLQLESFQNLHIVLGMVKDKKHEEVLELLPKKATYYFTRPNNMRAISSDELQAKSEAFDLKGNTFADVLEALDSAKTNALKQDFILICGSTFLLEDIL